MPQQEYQTYAVTLAPPAPFSPTEVPFTQTEPVTGRAPFVRCWLHSAMVELRPSAPST